MKSIFISLFITLCLSSFVAAALPESIAIEFQENGKFAGIIGKAYVTEKTMEVVTFIERDGVIAPFAFLYTILEKTVTGDIYSLKCQNQLGIIVSGTVDTRNKLKPTIILKSETGIIITNLSENGKKMKAKFLPKVDLGK